MIRFSLLETTPTYWYKTTSKTNAYYSFETMDANHQKRGQTILFEVKEAERHAFPKERKV